MKWTKTQTFANNFENEEVEAESGGDPEEEGGG